MLVMLFVIFKMATFATSLSESARQSSIGVLLVVIIFFLAAVNIAYVTVCFIMLVYRLLMVHVFKQEDTLTGKRTSGKIIGLPEMRNWKTLII